MASISTYLKAIKDAVYGAEVRDAIHDSISQCYTDVTAAETLADTAATNANTKATLANTKATLANTKAELANTAATNANAARDAANTATANANAATDAANTAATNANNKATLANTAATNANTKATLADTKATLADEKATLANTAATNADQKATLANTAATNADAKAALANTATTAANTATKAANEATTKANTATDAANTAAAAANTKALLADEKATLANQKAEAANTAASNADAKAALAVTATTNANAATKAANTAASNADAKAALAVTATTNANAATGRANTAAASIEGMTVEQVSVPNGTALQPTITRDDDGNIHISLQTEEGKKYTILGKAYATVAALEAAITSPEIGDQYNVGSAPPYEVYRWTGTEWEAQGTIQGESGYSPTVTAQKANGVTTLTIVDVNGTKTAKINDGDPGAAGYSPTVTAQKADGVTTVTITDINGTRTAEISDGVPGEPGKDGLTTSVNGVMQVDGNVEITGEDIPVVSGVGDADSDGRTVAQAILQHDQTIVSMTTDELAALDTAARVALYAEGVRQIVVTDISSGGGLMSLDALGACRRMDAAQPVNLLDNSNFLNPVAQAGVNGLHGTIKYPIDRWRVTGTGVTVSAGSDGLTCVRTGTSGVSVFQNLPQTHAVLTGKTLTAAMGLASGQVLVLNVTVPEVEPTVNTPLAEVTVDGVTLRFLRDGGYYKVFFFGADGVTYTVQWVALYEGHYTADTLPTYVPKPYIVELEECQRYFYNIDGTRRVRASLVYKNHFDFTFNIQAMRVKPTVTGFENVSVMELDTTVLSGFTYSTVFMHKDFVDIRATKTGHGLADAMLNITGNGLSFNADL